MSQRPDCDLQAELDALRQKIDNLEARHRNSLRSATRSWRLGFSRKFLLGALALAALLTAGGLLYGQGAGEALFIDTKGNVGISTNAPNATLDVAGSLNVSNSTTLSNANIAGSLTTATLNVMKNASLADTTIKGTLTTPALSVSSETKGVRVNSWLDLTSSVCGMGSIGTNLYLNYSDNKWKWANNHPTLGGTAIQFDDCTGASASKIMFLRASGPPTADADAPVLESMRIDNNGNVGIGTTDPKSKLEVNGDAMIKGKITHSGRLQVNDQAEKTYEISPRYHLSLTAPIYEGRTKLIPQDILENLCGDSDGCEFRIGMTRWSSDAETETASRSGLFYYSKTDGHWRASLGDRYGVDGNGKVEHAYDDGKLWQACYFTDGSYSNNRAQGDAQKGMYLLLYKGSKYHHRNRTCELTLID